MPEDSVVDFRGNRKAVVHKYYYVLLRCPDWALEPGVYHTDWKTFYTVNTRAQR